MSAVGYSLTALEQEITELRKDYVAFGSAYDLLQKRILESDEVQPIRTPELRTWSGARAVCGSLEMACHSLERTILECAELIHKVRYGEIPNTDMSRPMLSLVKETDNQ